MPLARHLTFVISLACMATPALAQESKIDAFLTDPIEVYDVNEEYIDDYEVGDIDAKAVKVLEENADMIKIDFAGQHEPAWIYRTDVKSPAGCRVAATAKTAKSKNASTMGLDGDLCE